MKLVDGKYQKISWEQALNEVGDRLLKIREESGPDAVYFIGSSKHNNEQAYLLRKFVSLGHQQHRPPGAHLPLHHRGGRGEHLGLRRDDELLQRHAERQGDAVHRLERGRGAPGVLVAHPARQGKTAPR